MKEVAFLDKVQCMITKRTGVVYGIAKYVYEPDRYMVLFDGEKTTEWISSKNTSLVVSPTYRKLLKNRPDK